MDKVEKLEIELQQTSDPCHRMDILNQLIWTLGRKDLSRSTSLLTEVATLIQAKQHRACVSLLAVAEYHVNMGLVASYQGHYEDAIVHAKEALSHCDEGTHHLPRCKALEIIGICQVRLGNPSEALPQLLDALRIAVALGESEREANIYNTFAILYVNLGEHANGARYFQKSLDLSRTVGDRMSEARALVNLCMSYRDLGDYRAALTCGHKSLELAEQLGSQTLEMWAVSNLANTYLALGDSEKAFAYFKHTAQLAKELGDLPDQSTALLQLARALLREEKYAQAKSYAQCVLGLGQRHKQLGIQFEAHELLATISKVEGDFETALRHFEEFHYLKERIFNQEADERLKKLEVSHRTETAQRDAEIYQLRYVELQREIVEREHAQKALLYAQKLESLGILAGGVAHDFNNLLVGIWGQIDLALHKVGEGHPAGQNLMKAIRSVEQAANLSRKMLAYSGRGHFQIVQCDPRELFYENRELWRSIVGETCSLHFQSVPNCHLVAIDKDQIEQLFVNLLMNAAEANATSIRITVADRIVAADDSFYWQYTAQPLPEGEYIQITVADNGNGMDSAILEKLFDPFFTTKFTGRGLGMAATLGIIRGHRGGITVQSHPGMGTVIDFVLPIPATNSHPTVASSSPAQHPEDAVGDDKDDKAFISLLL